MIFAASEAFRPSPLPTILPALARATFLPFFVYKCNLFPFVSNRFLRAIISVDSRLQKYIFVYAI